MSERLGGYRFNLKFGKRRLVRSFGDALGLQNRLQSCSSISLVQQSRRLFAQLRMSSEIEQISDFDGFELWISMVRAPAHSRRRGVPKSVGRRNFACRYLEHQVSDGVGIFRGCSTHEAYKMAEYEPQRSISYRCSSIFRNGRLYFLAILHRVRLASPPSVG